MDALLFFRNIFELNVYQIKKQMSRIWFWIKCARYVALPQSFLPGVTAFVLAGREPSFSWGFGLLALVAIALAHLSFNLFDDFFDFKKNDVQIRNKMSSSGMRARIGKCDYLISGEATLPQLLRCAVIFGSLALGIGIFFLLYWGWHILIFIFLLGFLGIFYSAPPFRFSYRGLGELLIGFVFGPLLMSGLYFAATGVLDSAVWFLSFPIGLWVSNILFTHDIMDFEADKKSGKRTLCVIIGNQRVNLMVSLCFIFTPYLIVLYGILFHYLSIWMLSALLTLPQAVKLYSLLVCFVKEPEREFTPAWWMKPMESWDKIKEAGIDWFMIRWYLSRNLVVLFCVVVIVVSCLLA